MKWIKSKDRRRGRRREEIERKKEKGGRKEIRLRTILYLPRDARRSLQWGSQKRCHPAHQLWYHQYQKHVPLGREEYGQLISAACCKKCDVSEGLHSFPFTWGKSAIFCDIGFYNVKPSLDPGSIKVSEGTLPNVDVSDQQGKNVFVLNRKNG